MRDDLMNESVYDQDRLERHIWRVRRESGLSRRQVLKVLFATAGAAALGSLPIKKVLGSGPFVEPTPPDQFIILGTNAEMRWEVMKDKGYFTPNANFFIRDHTLTPTIDVNTWQLSIEGDGITTPLQLTYNDLLSMESVEETKFIECAGNGRSFYGSQQGTPAPGSQWHLGAVGVARWTGVRLSKVLELAGVKSTAIDVMPEGLDPVVGSDGHVRRPIPIQKALDDVLIVHTMNGEPLPPDHGFPVRMLVPGWVGIASIKWVGRITVSEEPLFSLWNTTQYHLFGPAYPDSPLLTNQMVKSAFELPFPAALEAGPQILTGRSWSGHGNINRVEVSTDGGATWQDANLGPVKPGPYDNGRRNIPQAWVQWNVLWDAVPGNYVLKARATDTEGNTQPDTVPFNTLGYSFWAVVNHPVTVNPVE